MRRTPCQLQSPPRWHKIRTMSDSTRLDMFLIGVTGGIASGKSTVCEMIREMGVKVVDADVIARKIVEVGTVANARIREEFGDEVFTDSGSVDRGKLGALIFSDESKRKALNAITHPQIYAQMRKEVVDYFFGGEQMVVLDLPLLFESGKALPFIYKTIVVNCDQAEQLRRLMCRGGYSEWQAKERIDCQMSLEYKVEQAHYVIENTGSKCYTREQVNSIFKVLKASNHHIQNKLIIYTLALALLALLIIVFYTILGFFV